MVKVVKILSHPKYLLLSLAVGLSMIVFAAWLPNLHLIMRTMTSSMMTIWQKTNLLTDLLGSLQTNFTPLSRTTTFISAGMTGIQVSLLVYYLRRVVHVQKSLGMSALGVMSSMLGVGCASCGSVVLSSLIGLGASTVVLGYLPFRGAELGILGIGILLLAMYVTIKKINDPLACGVRSKS